jgi:undecaprenyl-diphosphatase
MIGTGTLLAISRILAVGCHHLHRMLLSVAKPRSEMFSFALAVVLTPALVAREAIRLVHAEHISGTATLASAAFPNLLGVAFAFLAGRIAQKWLQSMA